MAIQYYMRAYNTTLATYVDWIVNDAPDTTGTYSGYPTNQLVNIIVNRTVNSKVSNFLKSNQSLGGFDGYYFHVNSYDWLRAVSPINPPTTLTGLAVERGITSVTTVTAATNATPIQITSGAAHGLSTGGLVTIAGVQGNVAANGTFPVTVINATTFTLTGSEGSGTYTSGGTIFTPNNFSTITWDEASNVWRFVLNTNGDGTTLGAHQNLRVNNLFIDGYEALGTLPATAGILRVPNNQFMDSRDFGNTANIQLIGADNLNRIKIGLNTTDLTYMPGNLIVDGYIVHDGTGANVATTGFIREQNNTTIVAFRDQANTNNIAALSSTTANKIVLGDAVNAGINYNVATGANHGFQVNSITTLELGDIYARFTANVVTPTITQVTPGAGVSGQTLTVQAQNGGTGATTGGIASITSGTGGSFGGTVDLSTGGTLKVRIHPTTSSIAANSNTIQLFENKLRFDTSQVLPRVMQDDVTTSAATGTSLYFQAQNATGAGSTGGNAVISAGSGTSTNGNVLIQTGGINQIIVSPNLTTILGNLLVNGTTSSYASTVVDIADRVVHYNSSADIFPGGAVAAPTQITGFSIDRGSPTGTAKRDYYGLFWVESDGYWKFSANTDGYTTENTLFQNLPLMSAGYVAQPLAAVVAGAIPTVGGFRALNNTVALASRNALGTQDLPLVSTDATNHLIWGSGTNNAGHIFNTTVSTIYDFQVNSVSTYTITPISGGLTTLQATATVTALVYSHATTGNATGANTTMQAQNAATTGGNLVHTSGTGATTAGNVQLQTGGVDKLVVHPAFTEFRDTAEAFRITPVSAGATVLQAATGATSVTYKQADLTISTSTGANTTVQAQNATGVTSTGGNLVITSGTGTAVAGNVQLQTGAVDRVVVHPTFTEFRDTAEAIRITPASSGTSQILFASTVASASMTQTTTGAATGTTLTVQAQNALTTGGNLVLGSGTGATTAGTIAFLVGGVTTATVVPNKLVFNKGRRRNVTAVTTTYPVLDSDDYLAITALAAPFTITLPASPTLGDTYEIKDTTGLATPILPVTVAGNGKNIDGNASLALSAAYAAVVVTYTGTQWSIS